MSEYERLSSEILGMGNEIVQYNSILYTATAAILVFAFEKGNYLYFLLPYVVIIPLQLLTENSRRNICRLYAYMFVFLEGKEYLYERRHQKYNENVRTKDGPILTTLKQMRYRFQYFLVLILCAVLSIHRVISGDIEKKYPLAIFISVIMIFAVVIMAVNLTDYIETTQTFISRWQAIKDAEEQAPKQQTTVIQSDRSTGISTY